MTKLLNALKHTFEQTYSEPPVHFHRGTTNDNPEVCYDAGCQRPRLRA